MCGEHYFITYEDENGTWRALPINDAAIDIGYMVLPGGHHCLQQIFIPKFTPINRDVTVFSMKSCLMLILHCVMTY